MLAVLHYFVVYFWEGLAELVEQTFDGGDSLCLVCGDKKCLFASERPKRYIVVVMPES